MADIRRNRVWRDFLAWCTARRLRALPAHPWTLAAYLRWCDAHRRSPDIPQRLEAIAWAHLMQCSPSPHRHPVVARTLRRIESLRHAREVSSALFPDGEIRHGDRRNAKPATRTKEDRPAPRRTLRGEPPLVERRPTSG